MVLKDRICSALGSDMSGQDMPTKQNVNKLGFLPRILIKLGTKEL
jgi:hypothetical protein